MSVVEKIIVYSLEQIVERVLYYSKEFDNTDYFGAGESYPNEKVKWIVNKLIK